MHQETVKVRATIKPLTRGAPTRVVRSKIRVSVPDSIEEALSTYGPEDVLEMIGKEVTTRERLKAYDELVRQEKGAVNERVEEDVEIRVRNAVKGAKVRRVAVG